MWVMGDPARCAVPVRVVAVCGGVGSWGGRTMMETRLRMRGGLTPVMCGGTLMCVVLRFVTINLTALAVRLYSKAVKP